jgi:hypothetical protein
LVEGSLDGPLPKLCPVIPTSKFVWLKVASVDCEILLIVLFFFLLVSSKDVYQSYVHLNVCHNELFLSNL